MTSIVLYSGKYSTAQNIKSRHAAKTVSICISIVVQSVIFKRSFIEKVSLFYVIFGDANVQYKLFLSCLNYGYLIFHGFVAQVSQGHPSKWTITGILRAISL